VEIMDTVRDRHAIEQSQSAIGLRRWNSLTIEERRKLIDLITSDMSDKQIFTAYMAVREPSKIGLWATEGV
jgi:hypothetical protein